MNIFRPETDFYTGHIVYKPNARFGPRQGKTLIILYVYEGRIDYQVNKEWKTLSRDQACVILPGQREFFQFSRSGPTRHGWCEIRNPGKHGRLVNEFRRLPATVPFTPRMKDIAELATPLARRTDEGACRIHYHLAAAFFMEFLSVAGFTTAHERPPHPAVARVQRLVQERYAEPLSLQRMAAEAGVSEAHLIRLFKEHRGETPTRFLWRTRLEAAARLLQETGLTAEEVGYACGFASPHHFSRAFRQAHGRPPGAFRRARWKATSPGRPRTPP